MLPVAIYSSMYATCNARALMNFLSLRRPGQAPLDHPDDVALLLSELPGDAAQTLLARAAAHASPDNPRAVALLLWNLRAVGDTAQALLARGPARHARLYNPEDVAYLLRALRRVGADDTARTLAARAANAGMFDLFLKVRPDEASNYRFGREPDGTPSEPWNWQEPVNQSRGLSAR